MIRYSTNLCRIGAQWVWEGKVLALRLRSEAFNLVALRRLLWCDHPQFLYGGAWHVK